mgnify:CR=1 FL=1
MFDPQKLLRPHLKTLVPYTSARDEYKGDEGVFLDANENPIGSITEENWNRYPDPYQLSLKAKLAEIKGVDSNQIFLGNGSDEPIDLIYRAFCEPGNDEVIINAPTYGMYKVSADINNVSVKEVLLTDKFDLDQGAINKAISDKTKVIWICSPNNPTGNDLSIEITESILKSFNGLVVIDEAYIDFADRPSWINRLNEFPNLIVLQTMSKAWGLAALRMGIAFCSVGVRTILDKIKAPYNLSGLTQRTVLDSLKNLDKKEEMVKQLLLNRDQLGSELESLEGVVKVYPTDANFFLVKMINAREVYLRLIEKKVILRDRSGVVLCEGGIRITVGTEEENERLIKELKKLK